MDQRHWLPELESEIESRHLYESQVPAISEAKIEGLRRFYRIRDARGLEFFEVHRRVDIEHAQAEREILQTGALSPAERERVHTAVQESAAALWGLLDGVRRAYGVN